MIEYNPQHWFDHLFDIRGTLIREITWRVLTSVVWAAFVVKLGGYLAFCTIPETVHSLIGVALGLLLVFRTNSSYDRYWEGRRLWGGIINESRNLARSVSVHLAGDPDLRRSVVYWTALFPYTVMHSLRGMRGIGPIADRLPSNEIDAVLGSDHPPLAVARRITARLAEARDRGLISDIVLTSLDQNVQLLIGHLGGCERILKTPLPFAYVVHLRRLLIIYCLTLPFALCKNYGWVTVPATLGVAYTLFGIEEIGVEIENPFSHCPNDLPLEGFCATVERNLVALVDAKEPAGSPA